MASAGGPAEPGGEPAVALRCEDGRGFRNSAQLGQGLGEGWAGRVQAADGQPQAGAEPGAADQRDDHRRAPEVGSGVVNSELVRNRPTSTGRVMRESQTNAVANTAPTKTRTSWPVAVS